MSQLPNSRQPGIRKAFEIMQSENKVTIITRDPETNEVAKVVTFRGQSDPPDNHWATHRLTEPNSTRPRW